MGKYHSIRCTYFVFCSLMHLHDYHFMFCFSARRNKRLNGVQCHLQHYCSYINAASAPIHTFPEFPFSTTQNNILFEQLAAFSYNHHWHKLDERERIPSHDYQSSFSHVLYDTDLTTLVWLCSVLNSLDKENGFRFENTAGWGKMLLTGIFTISHRFPKT